MCVSNGRERMNDDDKVQLERWHSCGFGCVCDTEMERMDGWMDGKEGWKEGRKDGGVGARLLLECYAKAMRDKLKHASEPRRAVPAEKYD